MRWSHLLLLAVLQHALQAAALPAPQGIFDKFKRPRRNTSPGPPPPHHTGPQVSYTYQVNNHYHLIQPVAPPPPPVVWVPHPATVPYMAPAPPHPAAVAAHMHAQAQAHAQAQVQAVHAAARAARDRAQQAWQRDQARIFAGQQMARAHAQQAQTHYPPRPFAPVAPVAPYPPMGHNRYAATATGYPPGPGQFSSAVRYNPPCRATTPPPFNTGPRYADAPAQRVRPVRQPTLAIMPPPPPGSEHNSHAHSSAHGSSRGESRRPPSILSDFSIPPAVGQRPIAKYRPELAPEPEEWDYEEGPSSRPSRSGERRSRSNNGKKRRS